MFTLLKIKDGDVVGWVIARDLNHLKTQIIQSTDNDANAVLHEINHEITQGRTILSNGLIVLRSYGC